MKAILITFFLTFTVYISIVIAQNDTMYIMKNGQIVGHYNVNTEIDSIIFYLPKISFICGNSFIDTRDGYGYSTTLIANKCWLAENLKYLPSVIGPEVSSYTIPYYYVFGYNGTNVDDAKASANFSTYGVLYNWPAAMNGTASSSTNPSGVQGVCPFGWHLPSDAEWTELTDILGGDTIAGGKLKEVGIIHWYTPNTGATNETGFTALPGGYKDDAGSFGSIGYGGSWWSSSEYDTYSAWGRYLGYGSSSVFRIGSSMESGFSVRCIRD